MYGVELLEDNMTECRANLLENFADYLNLSPADDLYRAALQVLQQNLVLGDALTMETANGAPITFPECGYLGKGRYQRRDFRMDVLTGAAAFSAEDSLFANVAKEQLFQPIRSYPAMTVHELAAQATGET